MRRVVEAPKSNATLFLELGILRIQYEIEKRQLIFLKGILDRQTMTTLKELPGNVKIPIKKNWANNVHELHSKYNLPVNYENVCNLTYPMWKNDIRPGNVYGILFID